MKGFLEFVENNQNVDSGNRLYRAALTSFLDSARREEHPEAPDAIARWEARMILAALKPSTRQKYFRVIEKLRTQWCEDLKEPLSPLYPSVNYSSALDRDLMRVSALTGLKSGASDFEHSRIALLMLFDPTISADDIIGLTFDAPVKEIPQVEEIIAAMRYSVRKKYVFALGQGKQRVPRIKADMDAAIVQMLKTYGFSAASVPVRQYLTDLWIAAAMQAGIAPGAIRSIVPSLGERFRFIEAFEAERLTEPARTAVLQKVADSLHDTAPQWHVMKLRPGNTPEAISNMADATAPAIARELTFYYPTRQVMAVDKKGKRTAVQRPWLPGILFFKLRTDHIPALFSHIGHAAWCYRRSASPDSPYCTIPLAQMKAFQRQIGTFTPDVEIHLTHHAEPLPPGTKVKINSGMMENHIGFITDVRNPDGTRTYTLALSENEAATWTVQDIPEIYVEPLDI